MRPFTRISKSITVVFALTLLGAAAARAEDDDPAKGHFTLEEATKGLPGSGPLVAKIETTQGTFTCELFDKQAPITVANFVGLARGLRPFKDKDGKWTKRLLRRADFPPRHPGLHDPGR